MSRVKQRIGPIGLAKRKRKKREGKEEGKRKRSELE